MHPKARRLTTVEQCESLEANAIRGGDKELAKDARRRALEIKAAAQGAANDVERECLQAVYAYERAKSDKAGRTFTAVRTWQVLRKDGVIPAVEQIVTKKNATMGFTTLEELGLLEYAFEAVVLRHPASFSESAREISRQRLATIAGDDTAPHIR